MAKSEWRQMTFEAIRQFADLTGDHQWIHVDRERLVRESPFGKPVAHGYFTLSLIGELFYELVETKNFALGLNYGLNKVRFPAPLKDGQRYRMTAKLAELTESGNTFDALNPGGHRVGRESEARLRGGADRALRCPRSSSAHWREHQGLRRIDIRNCFGSACRVWRLLGGRTRWNSARVYAREGKQDELASVLVAHLKEVRATPGALLFTTIARSAILGGESLNYRPWRQSAAMEEKPKCLVQ